MHDLVKDNQGLSCEKIISNPSWIAEVSILLESTKYSI